MLKRKTFTRRSDKIDQDKTETESLNCNENCLIPKEERTIKHDPNLLKNNLFQKNKKDYMIN